MFLGIKDLQDLLDYRENEVFLGQQVIREVEEIQVDLVLKAHQENKEKEDCKESVAPSGLQVSQVMQEIQDLQVPLESLELRE